MASATRRLEGKYLINLFLYTNDSFCFCCRNYAPTIKTGRKGAELHGCDQALWLLHDYVTEVGTMNFFVFWKNEDGEDELITPPLDGTILPGITRDTILKITAELKEFKVKVKPFKI